MVVIGITIGSGIFRVPARVAGLVGSPGMVAVAWVLGGILALFGALTLAELAAMYPRSGGVFAYIEEGLGPLPAFLFGWSQLAVIRASALGAISTIFAEYFSHFVPLTDPQVHWVAAALIAGVGLLNYVGVKKASAVTNIATTLKYGALISLVVLAFTSPTGSTSNFTPLWVGGLGVSALATAMVSVMWAYDGWADLSYMSGEIKDPARNLPRALIFGTLAIIAIYLLVNLAYMYLVPLPEIATSPLIAATAVERIPFLGTAGAGLIAAVVMVSTFSSVNGTMMASPRIFFGMADRGLFFPIIARVSEVTRPCTAALVTPWPATTSVAPTSNATAAAPNRTARPIGRMEQLPGSCFGCCDQTGFPGVGKPANADAGGKPEALPKQPPAETLSYRENEPNQADRQTVTALLRRQPG